MGAKLMYFCEIMNETKTYVAKTMDGLEQVLAGELNALGAKNITTGKRSVQFDGDTATLYRANYCLRTALRIFSPIKTFTANKEKELYEGVRGIVWNQFMQVSQSLAVDALVNGDIFRHARYVALLTKDAIVDQFREAYNRRPNVDTVAPNIRIHVHIRGNEVDIALDTSGESLHKRGYRKATVEAPLNEVLAAGMVLLSGWQPGQDFVDPMCGSGTLPIEAAWIATKTPPQINRNHFGFTRWPDFDPKLWSDIKTVADAQIQPLPGTIIGSDLDKKARNATAVNLMASGMDKWIKLYNLPFQKLLRPSSSGTMILNPPYDERMQIEQIQNFYGNIGDRFKKEWQGWRAWIISSNRNALKSVGLRTSKKLALTNGALECGYYQYEMYEGRKIIHETVS